MLKGVKGARSMAKDGTGIESRTLLALERERAEVARAMRACSVQVLATVLVGLTAAEHAGNLDDVRAALADLRRMVREDLARVERCASEIRPSVLDDFGLAAAVRATVASLRQPDGPAVELDWPEESPRLTAECEVLLFRIVQEALRNAVRHAAARGISVRLTRAREHLLIEVHDDGRGFRPNAGGHARLGGDGIVLMQAQAQALGCDLELRSQPDRGTTVRLRLPLQGATR